MKNGLICLLGMVFLSSVPLQAQDVYPELSAETRKSLMKSSSNTFFSQDRFSWTNDFKQTENEALLKAGLQCDLDIDVESKNCEGICKIQNKFPKGFLDNTRVNGKKLGQYASEKMSSNSNSVDLSQIQYKNSIESLKGVLLSLDSENSCEKFIKVSNANYVAAAKLGLIIDGNSDVDDVIYRRKIRCLLDECEKQLGYVPDGQETVELTSCVNKKLSNKSIEKIDLCTDPNSKKLCTKLFSSKSKIEDHAKKLFGESRANMVNETKRALRTMSDDQLDRNFGSFLSGKNQKDAAYDYVYNLSLEAQYSSCLNSTAPTICLEKATEKFNQSMKKRGTTELAQSVKDAPELQVFHKELDSFLKELKKFRGMSERDRHLADMDCLKNMVDEGSPSQPSKKSSAETGKK